MENIYRERLEKLADHLESGKLGHDQFFFGTWHNDRDYAFCGTAGCAVGELPFLFPDDWGIDGKYPILRVAPDLAPEDAAMSFFDLGVDEVEHLFIPELQDTDVYGGEFLLVSATKEQVASNIREFLKIKEWA